MNLTTGSLNEIFAISRDSSVNFNYVTLNAWDKKTDTSGEATQRFEKVTHSEFKDSSSKKVVVTSDHEGMVEYFSGNNAKRITTEKIEIGDVGIQFVNQKGVKVGEPIIIDIDKDNLLVNEEVVIPQSVYNQIPEGYHLSTTVTQPKFAYTGMKGVDDPRITEVFIQGNSIDAKVNYITPDGQVVKTETLTTEVGTVIDFSSDDYKNKIDHPYVYAT